MIATPPPARVRVWSDPASPHRICIVVACPFRTTVREHATPPEQPRPWVEESVTVAAFAHAAECARCDLAPVHARGAPWLYRMAMWALADADPASRRN